MNASHERKKMNATDEGNSSTTTLAAESPSEASSEVSVATRLLVCLALFAVAFAGGVLPVVFEEWSRRRRRRKG